MRALLLRCGKGEEIPGCRNWLSKDVEMWHLENTSRLIIHLLHLRHRVHWKRSRKDSSWVDGLEHQFTKGFECRGRWDIYKYFSRQTVGNARSFQAGQEHAGLSLFLHSSPPCWLPLSPPYPALDFSQRRRAYSTNQITHHKPSPRAPTASDPTVPAKRYPLRKAKLQDLTNQSITDAPWWQIDLQVPEQGGLELGRP